MDQYRVNPNSLLAGEPGNFSKLPFPPGFTLNCLHGRHRIAAAAAVLPEQRLYWAVDFYPQGKCHGLCSESCVLNRLDISLELKLYLIEGYSNENRPEDGEFYLKIRRYRREDNTISERQWLARLEALSPSKHSAKMLQQLFNHSTFSAPFMTLEKIPALFGGLCLSVFNKMVSLRCHEVG